MLIGDLNIPTPQNPPSTDLSSTLPSSIDYSSPPKPPPAPFNTSHLPPTTTSPPMITPCNLSIPLPATENPFPPGFVMSDMVEKHRFQVFTYGTVYGFSCAPNGVYSMVFAVQFTSINKLKPVQREAVDAFVEFVPATAKYGHNVKGNAAQNAKDE